MTKRYRTGAIGALLDEYERAITELKNVIADITGSALVTIVDAATLDDNCRSVQTILSHVVHAGYGYGTSIHNWQGHDIARPEKTLRLTIGEYVDDLTNMFVFTENVFTMLTDNDLERFDNAQKMKTGWGQWYDVEQLTEHAIVHILRHRRQIEKFKAGIVLPIK